MNKEELKVLASAWFRQSKKKLQKLKTDLQVSKGSTHARYLDMTLHETDPEEYQKRKELFKKNLTEMSLKIQVLDLIMEKK